MTYFAGKIYLTSVFRISAFKCGDSPPAGLCVTVAVDQAKSLGAIRMGDVLAIATTDESYRYTVASVVVHESSIQLSLSDSFDSELSVMVRYHTADVQLQRDSVYLILERKDGTLLQAIAL